MVVLMNVSWISVQLYPPPPNCMQQTTEDITALLVSALEPGM